MKTAEEVMEILEAFDLVGTLRGAAELAGCDHKTVARHVEDRERAGGSWQRGRRGRPRVDRFTDKIDELVHRSHGKIRADKVHERLLAIGYQGSERTTRRAVAEAKRAWRRQHGRRTRPWIPEPGLWMQWDYAEGPEVRRRATSLFCAWLAWSRYRVVLPLRDRTPASVVLALDRSLRRFGGAPTYALTDNERTVTADHVCGIAIRNPRIVAASRHYGLTVATCVPADPQSKGGSEATVRIAKADLVPTDDNLRPAYASFAELEAACEEFCERVNARAHPISGRRPAEALLDERARLHPLPAVPHTLTFGETRRVSWQATISLGGAVYSVPHELVDERVWARVERSELVVVNAEEPSGPREVARHALTTPGKPRIDDAHYPPRPPGALERRPRAQNAAEAEFLQIGEGALAWLTKAAAVGAGRVRRKMAEAVDLAKLHGAEAVDEGLRVAAAAGRFADGDLAAILAHRRSAAVIELPVRASQPPERASLQRSTAAWSGFGAHNSRNLGAALEDPALRGDLRACEELPRVKGRAAEAPLQGEDGATVNVKGTGSAAAPGGTRAAPAPALRPRGRAGGDRHRHRPALGAGRGAARALGRGGRRSRSGDDPDAPARLRASPGQDFAAWDESAAAIPKATQQALRTLEWIERGENLCVCGPSGTGKSHFAEALGHEAIERGKKVAWHTLESLAGLVRRHRADDSVAKAIAKLISADLVIVDDVGMLPVAPEAAEALFRVVDAGYERRSLALTSNIHPAGFDELMPKTLAAATVDRLLHHAHVVITDGAESYRLAQATAGKGVVPLR